MNFNKIFREKTMKKFSLLLIGLIFTFPAYAQEVELKDPRTRDEDISNTIVKVDVSMLGDGNYLYNYTLESPLSNKGKILSFSVDSSCDKSVNGPIGYDHIESLSKDGNHLNLGYKHPDYEENYPPSITASNLAHWIINRTPGTSLTNILLISPEAPTDREYKLRPSMPTYGWAYDEDSPFDDSIPWTDDFIVIGTIQGPECPPEDNGGGTTPDPDPGDGSGSGDDPDGDGWENEIDNCWLVYNPGQEDEDEDGNGDACEEEEEVLDFDEDGIPDDEDNCINQANTDQADNDNDSKGDVCDEDDDNDDVQDENDSCPLTGFTRDTNPVDGCEDSDKDSDGIYDDVDNCPMESNADQADIDTDGLGDVCDEEEVLDSDEDGILDNEDNCPMESNSDQADIDTDGLGDACDDINDNDNGEGEGEEPNGECHKNTRHDHSHNQEQGNHNNHQGGHDKGKGKGKGHDKGKGKGHSSSNGHHKGHKHDCK